MRALDLIRNDRTGFTMIIKIHDGRMAEIIVKAEVPDAMVLANLLLAHGIAAAKIIKSKPATGEPAINIVHATQRN